MKQAPILLVAYQCGPGMGSVSRIGWEWLTGLARVRPVTLLTHVRNRPAIDAAGPLPDGAEVHYIDTEWLARPLYGIARRLFPRSEHSVFLVSQCDYFAFDRAALRTARRIARRHDGRLPWAVAHVVTPVTLSAPTVLHRLGLPLVRGPLNCGLGDPPGFGHVLRQESRWLWRVRDLLKGLDRMLGSIAHTDALLVATRATAAAVPAQHRHRCIPMLENAVDLACFTPGAPLPRPGPDEPLAITFAGRLVPVKALDLLLHAMHRLNADGIRTRLTVAGDGPMRGPWEALARRLGLAAQVRFAGNLGHEDVARAMHDCHVFCLPSVRESGGAVLFEAMACERPVIGLDFGGPAEIVDDEVGRCIPFDGPNSAIDGLADALRDCAQRADAWRWRGIFARQRIVDRHTWDARIAAAEQVYDRLSHAPEAAARGARPAPLAV
ncbi:glycosyltransferase family 4 protein [Burkholderia paludis]|uniref:glycosyltransferase family 4 protein n=1 Tax=Burkholderia paludis TaxID=1506587 RepID=UPI0007C86062|nr:glycosyltransferase family 4 protein [Burkholderia paludis]